MAIPRSVKKQAKEAKELQTALNTDPAEIVAPIEKPAEELEQPAVVLAEKEQPNLSDQDMPISGEEPNKDQKPDWEAKYKGLQRTYNREVPVLRGQLSTAEDKADSLQKDMDKLKESVQKLETAPPAPQEVNFSDEEIEQYGEGNIGMMKKIAAQSNGDLAKTVLDLQQQLADVKQGVTAVRETVVVNNERDFRSALGRKVKAETGREWLDINSEDEFESFLKEIVPYTNDEKQVYLVKAHKNFDVDAAAKFFIDYAGPSSSKKEPEPTVPDVPEELITPETSTGGIPPIKEDKVYTTAEVDQFYSDKRKGKYKDANEARKIEQDILEAGKQGRIVNQRAYAHA